MEIVFKYAKQKNIELKNCEPTFQGVFNVIHSQGDRIFAEYIDMFEVRTVSYNQIKEYIYKMASYLAKQISLPKDSFVGMYMENSVDWVATFWALLMIGYKPLLLNCKLPDDINNQIIKTMNVTTVVTNKPTNGIITKWVNLPGSSIINAHQALEQENWSNQIAICSTASTMNYKICVYSGANMQQQLINAKDIIHKCPRIKKHYKHRLKLLAFLPLYHIFGFIATYMWFCVFGRTIVFLSNYSADTILYTIRRCEVTHIFAVPMFWNTIVKSINKQVSRLPEKKQKKFIKGQKLGLAIQNLFPNWGIKITRKLFKEIIISTLGESIQCLISGGGYIPNSTLYLFNSIGYPLYNGYGATETGIICVELRSRPKYRIQGSVGKPLKSVQSKIENNELIISGKSTCEYLINKDGNKQILNGNPFNSKDIAYQDKKGNLFIHGRHDDIIIGENGEKINPDLIEKEIFFNHITNYVVTSINKKTSLVIQLPQSTNVVILKQIHDEIQTNIKKIQDLGYSLESIYFTNDHIAPQNAIKVSRKIFHKLLLDNKVQLHNYTDLTKLTSKSEKEETDDITQTIKKIFAQVLNKNVAEINSNQHFFIELGGTSIDYCTCVTRIEDEFNIALDATNTKCLCVSDFVKVINNRRREYE